MNLPSKAEFGPKSLSQPLYVEQNHRPLLHVPEGFFHLQQN